MNNLDDVKVLTRSELGIISGTCSGLADYYGLRKNGLRLAFILTSFFFILPLFFYLVLWLVLPKYPNSNAMLRQLRRKTLNRKRIKTANK